MAPPSSRNPASESQGEPPSPSPDEPAEVTAEEGRRDAIHQALLLRMASARPLIPWVSLASGVATAVLMDRGPKRAPVIAGAAVALWASLVGWQIFERFEAGQDATTDLRRRAVRVARFSSLLLTQSLVQLCLFFCLPSYYRAASLAPPYTVFGHAVFLLGVSGLSLVSLWDPWTEALLARRYSAPLLPGAASFLALVVVLPGLGLSTEASVWCAAALAGIAIGLTSLFSNRAGGTALDWLTALLMGCVLPAALAVGGIRLIPPAPLRLAKAEFGSHLLDKWVAPAVDEFSSPPERLICATAIAAPLGVRDQLFHEWRINGKRHARMKLDIVGGRAEGYRTRSWLRQLGPGKYTCSVLTATGQVLGRRKVSIHPHGSTHSNGLDRSHPQMDGNQCKGRL